MWALKKEDTMRPLLVVLNSRQAPSGVWLYHCQLYQFFFDLYVSRAYEQGIRDEGEEERFGGKAPNCDTNLEKKVEACCKPKTMQMATTRQGDKLPKQYLKRNPTVQMAAIAATEFAMTRKPLWRPRLRSISPRDIFLTLHCSLWRMIGYLFRQMSSRGRRRRASKACHSHFDIANVYQFRLLRYVLCVVIWSMRLGFYKWYEEARLADVSQARFQCWLAAAAESGVAQITPQPDHYTLQPTYPNIIPQPIPTYFNLPQPTTTYPKPIPTYHNPNLLYCVNLCLIFPMILNNGAPTCSFQIFFLFILVIFKDTIYSKSEDFCKATKDAWQSYKIWLPGDWEMQL